MNLYLTQSSPGYCCKTLGCKKSLGYKTHSARTVDMLNKQGSPGLTRLEPDIDDIDPDDAFSRVPYEKGSLFLLYLEQVVGGEEQMTKYLGSYVERFRGRSIQTSDMKAHFLEFFKGVDKVKEIDWEHWLHGEGLPDFDLTAHVDKTLLEESRSAADRWLTELPEDLAITSMKAQQVNWDMGFTGDILG